MFILYHKAEFFSQNTIFLFTFQKKRQQTCYNRNMKTEDVKGRHCIKYIVDGPLKPTFYEYVPTKEITAQEERRLKLFTGILVRRRATESAKENNVK